MPARSGFRLVREIGLEYLPSPQAAGQEPLAFPSVAERMPDGSTLIVDELGLEKVVPIRAESRTLRIDAGGRLLYDSRRSGIDDGYGRALPDGRVALLRRTQWSLDLVSPAGERVDRIDLSRLSKRMPRIFAPTSRETFLILFLDAVSELDLVEIDRGGRLLWQLPRTAPKLGVPGTIELVPGNRILLADEVRHVVLELDRDGSVAWRFGEEKAPADDDHHLSSPRAASRLAGGGTLVADSRNHRLLDVAPDGEAKAAVPLPREELCLPTWCQAVPGGGLLLCDAGNHRVVELDARGEVCWQYGGASRRRRWLSFPRSVVAASDGGLVVCDTAHNRIVRVDAQGALEPLPVAEEVDLFWPRCARLLASGSLLVADGRNSRIVEVGADGALRRELHGLEGDRTPLGDPHDVSELRNGNLLVVDPSRDLVLEVSWEGEILWTIGEGAVELADPHSAQSLPDGRILIADTGNDRLLLADVAQRDVREIEHLHGEASLVRLNRPRHAVVSPDGTLLVVDTGNNRVLAASTSARWRWTLDRVPDSPLPLLDQPRWCLMTDRRELAVCDHYNHRILVVACPA